MQSNKPRMDTMLPWIPFCSKRKRHFINSPYNMLRSHTSNPTFILVHSWSTIMKPSLSLVLQTPLMNVWITLKHLIQTQWIGFYEVKAAHSDPKDRILSDEAYPEERSHGQSLDELKARFDIGNLHHLHTHCDGEDSDATETPRLCIWRQDLISVIHIEWRLMYDKSFGWLFITRYLSHDIGRQGAFWRTKAADSLKVPRVQSLS